MYLLAKKTPTIKVAYMDEEQQRQFNENLKLLNEMIPNLVSAMSAQTKAINDSVTAQKESIKADKDDTLTTKESTKSKKELTEAQKFEIESNKKLTEAKENLKKASETGKTSLQELSRAVLDTSTSFSKYGKALDSAGNTLSSVLSNFGFLGKTLSVVTQGATMLGKAFLEQADNALKFKDDLVKIGGVGAGTANDLIKMANSAGYSSKEFEKLGKPIKSIGDGLVSLGATAGDGVKVFGDLANVGSNTRMAFSRLGISQEELTQKQADYIKLQAASGKSLSGEAKDREKLKKESLAYVENLTRLSALTGKDADEVAKRQQLAMEEYEEVVRTRAENEKIRKLEAEGRTAEAEQIKNEQKARKQFITDAVNRFDKETGLQLARIARTGSFDQFTAGLATLGLDAAKIAQDLKKAKPGEETAKVFNTLADDVKTKVGQRVVQMDTALQYGGEELGKQTGLLKGLIVETGKTAERSEAAAEAEVQARTKAAQAAGTDPAADARAKLTEVEIAAKTTMDNLVASINPLLTDFPALHTALDTFKKSIQDIANIFTSGLNFLKNGFDGVTKHFVSFGATLALATAALAKFASSKLGDLAGTLGSKGGVAGKVGGKAVGGVSKALGMGARALGKIAAPAAGLMALYDGYQGFTADKDASTSQKLKNAGSSVLSGLTFGLLGKSADEIAKEKKLPATQASVRAVDNSIMDDAGQGAADQNDLDKLFTFTARSGSKENFEKLDQGFKEKVIKAATEYNALTGKKIQINSAKRDPADQQRLYQETVDAGRPGIGPTGMAVAPPGESKHEHGQAIDIQQYNDQQAVQAFNNQELYQKVPNDPVHFQARNGAIMSGPTSGYPVDIMAHGTEAIVPLPANSILEKLSKMSANDFENTNTINTTNITSTNSSLGELLAVNLELKTIMETKLSAMLDRLDMSVSIQDKLYKNAI